MATKDRQERMDASLQNESNSPVASTEGREIDIVSLLLQLLAHYKYIVAAALLGLILSASYTYMLVTPMYTTTSKLYILNSSDSALNLSDLQIGSYLAKDYLEVFNIWEVHENVIRNLNLDYSYSQLRGMLSVSNPSDTRILEISVTSKSPSEATLIANEYANVAKIYISDVMATDEPNILSVALEPTSPSSPNKTRNLLLGFVLGGFVAAGIICVMFILDDRIRKSDDIQDCLGVPTLGIIPVNGRDTTEQKHSKSKKRGSAGK